MKENDLSQTLNDLLDEFDRLDAESTRVSDRVGEREISKDTSKQASREQSEIDLLYSDPQVIDFWKSEGQRYSYLYWVRAMIHREVEPARIDPCAVPHSGDAAEVDRQRQAIYHAMAELLENPTKDLAGRVSSGALSKTLRAAPMALSGHTLVDEGLADLDRLTGMDVDDLLNEIRQEYARIIYDSFFPYVAPYESIYMGDRQVQGDITGQVYRDYIAADLKAEGEFADHIMHECSFVGEMIGRKLAADQSGDTEGAEMAERRHDAFLSSHLLNWGTRFGHDFGYVGAMVEENGRNRPAQSYVTGIGKLVVGFFTLEANRFNSQKALDERKVRFSLEEQEGNGV
ncbi:MAG: molecular chaperone TorD family protein [Rhodobacteraceae bacterium]|nr:molecular chaperone TorD family protein [Paracoccaceae bacterium]